MDGDLMGLDGSDLDSLGPLKLTLQPKELHL